MAGAKSKKKRFFLVLRILVVTAGFVFAFLWLSKGQRWENLKTTFSQINPAVFALTLVVFTVAHLIVSLRWWLLLRTQGIFIGFWPAVRLYFLGWFYNNFMPSSVGGDLVRAWYVTTHTDKKFEAALSVFVDRVIGLLSTLAIAVFFYTIFVKNEQGLISFHNPTAIINSLATYKSVIVYSILLIIAILAIMTLIKPGRMILSKIFCGIRTVLSKIVKKLKNAGILYSRKPLTILTVLALTIGMQIMTITAFWILGRGMGIEAGIKYYYVIFPLMWVIGAVPVSIGGAVVLEGGIVYLFVRLAGTAPEQALAIALCQRAIWMITSLPGAIIHLCGAHLPKNFFVDYEKPIK